MVTLDDEEEEKIIRSIFVKGFHQCDQMARSENTHLLCKGKYHCTADLLFDWLGFSRFAYVEY